MTIRDVLRLKLPNAGHLLEIPRIITVGSVEPHFQNRFRHRPGGGPHAQSQHVYGAIFSDTLYETRPIDSYPVISNKLYFTPCLN